MENPQHDIKSQLNLTNPWKCIMFYSNYKTQPSHDKVNISRSMKVHAAELDWIAKQIDK